jgi:hypothetical protein
MKGVPAPLTTLPSRLDFAIGLGSSLLWHSVSRLPPRLGLDGAAPKLFCASATNSRGDNPCPSCTPSIEIAKQPGARGFAALLFSGYRLQSRLEPCLRTRRVQILVDKSAAPEIWISSQRDNQKAVNLRAPQRRVSDAAKAAARCCPGLMMENAVARGPRRSGLSRTPAKRHSRGASRRARLRAMGTRPTKQLGPKTQRGSSPQ